MRFLPQGWIPMIAVFLVIWTISCIPLSYAQQLHTKDYIITDFGLRDSNTPFVTVQGKAGGSYDASVGDEGYQAYVFKTDKGNFMTTVAEDLYYSANHLLTDDIELDACLHTESGSGKPNFHDHTAEYLGHNLNLTNINHVYTIQVTLDDPDDECDTGKHVAKIYSQMGKQG